jgi:hypothetical protein
MDIAREKDRAGLCASCLHAHVLRSDRGAVFYQCRLAENDSRYPRYPRLPVFACRGFQARPASEGVD